MAMDFSDAVNDHIKCAIAQLYTSIPAIITDVSKLETENVVSVQPAIKKTTSDGFSYNAAALPDVPVQWPAGGGAVLTFPLEVGDDVLVICSMSSIAEWWLTSSGAVAPFDQRMHDLSDSFVIPKVFRKANNPSPSKDDVVLKYGGKSITLEKDDGNIIITTSTDTVINCTTAIVNGNAEINGNTIMNGNLTVDGTIEATGDITTDTNMEALGVVTGITNVVAGITPATVSVLTHTHYAADNVTPLTGTPILTP